MVEKAGREGGREREEIGKYRYLERESNKLTDRQW